MLWPVVSSARCWARSPRSGPLRVAYGKPVQLDDLAELTMEHVKEEIGMVRP